MVASQLRPHVPTFSTPRALLNGLTSQRLARSLTRTRVCFCTATCSIFSGQNVLGKFHPRVDYLPHSWLLWLITTQPRTRKTCGKAAITQRGTVSTCLLQNEPPIVPKKKWLPPAEIWLFFWWKRFNSLNEVSIASSYKSGLPCSSFAGPEGR